MILFILGLVIGSIGGMIMMAMFLTGKNRESSFKEPVNMSRPSNTATTDAGNESNEKR